MKATGTNTATNTKAIPITGALYIFHPLIAASLEVNHYILIRTLPLLLLRLASSTTRPIANTMANNVNVLIEKSSNAESTKCTYEGYWNSNHRNDRRSPGLLGTHILR